MNENKSIEYNGNIFCFKNNTIIVKKIGTYEVDGKRYPYTATYCEGVDIKDVWNLILHLANK